MHWQFLRYLIAGGFAVAVNLTVLYCLTEFVHIYYLVSAVCAFLVSFCVSFVLQKFWAFRDANRENVHHQMFFYLLLQLANVSLNTALLYLSVTYLHVWYLLAQAIISLLLAIGIYVINRQFIFKTTQ